MTALPTRRLGRSNLTVTALGLGTWALGGETTTNGMPGGYGNMDDAEAEQAVYLALESGINLVDTADIYGMGHSERMLRRALADFPEVLIATKFGNSFDEATKTALGPNVTPGYIRQAVRASLERLGRDVIDLYQLHTFQLTTTQSDDVVATLEELADQGLIRWYGVSNDDPAQIAGIAKGPRCTLVQIELNVLDDNPAALAAAAEHDLGVVCRSPLAMGLLGGRYSAATKLPANDIRGKQPEWLRWFTDGVPDPGYLERLDQVKALLTSGGRSVAQGALAWIWARSDRAIPLPGFRNRDQVHDNLGTAVAGPLDPATFAAIQRTLGR
ncbi:MAG: aldo/keto reductase [Bifidobacteriaceae bacterium]|nr:aldo/keto reductase [Bifidobacteriaceae bacterium]